MVSDMNNDSKIITPPNSKESEMMVLGCMLTSINSLKLAADSLEEKDFYHSEHGLIFYALQGLYKHDKPADVHLVSEELRRQSKLKDVGGVAYVMTLAQYAGTSAYIEAYCEELKGFTARRELFSITNSLSRALTEGVDTFKIVEGVKGKIASIEKRKACSDDGISQIGEILSGTKSQIDAHSYLEKIHKRCESYKLNGKPFLTGVSTGFLDLDKQVVILEDTNLIIVSARPAMGKTALALNVASHVCFEKDVPVGIISLEMGRDQLLERLLSMLTQISGEKIKRGLLTDNELKKISEIVDKISSKPLFIIDRGCSTISQVISISRQLKEEKKIGLLVVDYLQLLGTGGSSDSRQYEVAEISRGLKLLAMELKIPILCVAQLSRKVEERNDKRPLLSDLRDSGQIEQDADAVLFIYRRSYYDKDDKPNEAELLLRKNRHGPEVETKLYFDKDCGKFSNLAPIDYRGFQNFERNHPPTRTKSL